MTKACRPGVMRTCTSTGRASMPTNASVEICPYMSTEARPHRPKTAYATLAGASEGRKNIVGTEQRAGGGGVSPLGDALKEAQQPPPRDLYFTFYSWTRIHKMLRTTPAMAAGLTERVWGMEEIVALMDEVAPKPGRPKTYKKRAA